MDKEILEILKSMQSDVKLIIDQQQEDHSILKTLEHKAKHDKMDNDISHIKGDV